MTDRSPSRRMPTVGVGVSPEDDPWLRALARRSPLLADAGLRRHWLKVIPWLPVGARYELAAILLEIDRAAPCA